MTSLLTRWKGYLTPAPAITVDPTGARCASVAAHESYAAAVERGRDVTEVSDSLRDLRTRNHFADLWYESATPRSAP